MSRREEKQNQEKEEAILVTEIVYIFFTQEHSNFSICFFCSFSFLFLRSSINRNIAVTLKKILSM